jgi:DinB superfamily
MASNQSTCMQTGAAVPETLSRREALKVGAASVGAIFSLSHMTPAIGADLARLARGRPMSGARLAGILRAERESWSALLARVGAERLENPGVEGTWSVKEIVAHLTWYEDRVVAGARQVFGTGKFAKTLDGLAAYPMDERNERIADAARARPAADVLAEAERTFAELLTLIEIAPTKVLNDPRLLGFDYDFKPWMAVANNSYAHYREHAQAIEARLENA